MPFRDMDSWKACHALVLATYRATEKAIAVDRDLAIRLRVEALRAVGKVAFGAGCGNTSLMVRALYRARGWLWTFAAHLELARVMGVVAEEACVNLDALRGRAAFYLMRDLDAAVRRRKPR